MKIFNFFKKDISAATASSDFSKFFRQASPDRKKSVFIDVARKASADQREVIEAARKITSTVS
jgi:hypothetical protein